MMAIIYYTAFGDYSDYRPVARLNDGEWDIIEYEDRVPHRYAEKEHGEKRLLMNADGPTSFAFKEKAVPRDPSGVHKLGPAFETLGELITELVEGDSSLTEE